MKSSTDNASQVKKPASRRAKARERLPDKVLLFLLFDARLARPPRQPENLLEILRNRNN